MPTYSTNKKEDKSEKDLSISSLNLKEKLDAAQAYEGRKKQNTNVKDLNITIFEEGEEIVIPVLEEELHIDKEVIESGKIRIIKKVNEEKSTVEVPIKHTEVSVERRPKNEYVDVNHQAIRYEGDTMIVSVLKEVVVVQKKILLVEELHINKTQHKEIHTEEVTLKSEQVSVERSE